VLITGDASTTRSVSGGTFLPPDWRYIYEFYKDDVPGKRRAICDFVSGMTNRYCLKFHARLFGPEPPSIHKP
jgi:dGTPase